MTGQLIGSAGLVASPGYAFNGATKTGFYLAGTNQIGWSANGVQGATFNADGSVNFAGNVTIGGVLSASAIPFGAVVDFAGSAAPSKWLLCYGQQVSTTTYAALFAVLGTTYGSGAGTFGIPDYRGRTSIAPDAMGGVAANRLTVFASPLGATGGDELLQGHVHTGSGNTGGMSANDPHSHPSGAGNNGIVGSGGSQFFEGGGAAFNVNTFTTGTTSIAHTHPFSFTTSSVGLGNSQNVPPAIVLNKIIYSGV